MRWLVRLVSLVLGLNVFVGFAHAHHSQAGIFDSRAVAFFFVARTVMAVGFAFAIFAFLPMVLTLIASEVERLRAPERQSEAAQAG